MIDKLAEAGTQKNAEVLQTVIITSFPGEIYNISSIKPDWYIDKIKMTDKHIEQCLDNCIKSLKSKKQKLIVTLPNKLHFLINLKDVLYFEAQNKTTVFHLANGKEIMTVAKFGDIIKKVGINFQQCSRSYAVNFYYIVAFKWHKYILSDNTEITISRSSYGKMVNEYKLENNIIFLGKKQNPYPYFKLADSLILTSEYEGFPVVYLEAMILNIPIITTNVSDSLRIIQNKHGVVTQKNVNSIYNAMKNAIINGISQKEEFDYKEYNQEINEKLEKLIND